MIIRICVFACYEISLLERDSLEVNLFPPIIFFWPPWTKQLSYFANNLRRATFGGALPHSTYQLQTREWPLNIIFSRY